MHIFLTIKTGDYLYIYVFMLFDNLSENNGGLSFDNSRLRLVKFIDLLARNYLDSCTIFIISPFQMHRVFYPIPTQ